MTSETVACPNCGKTVLESELIPVDQTQVCPNCKELYVQRLKEGLDPKHPSGGHHLRRTHLKHEASLRSIGILYFISSVTLLIMMGVMVPVIFTEREALGLMPIALSAFYLVLGVLMFFMGLGIRKLRRWVRIPATLVACLGLISFPVGTLINGYILYLIWSEKGKMVFSDEYAEAIAKTPDMKYRSSALMRILLGLVLFFLFAILMAVLIPAISAR